MDIEQFRDYCLSKKGVTEATPFGPDTLVFRVVEKMFALTGLNDPEFRCNLKCEPSYAEELRGEYPDIIPGWHMNKKHWNTVYCERELDDKLIAKLVDHSYDQVVSKLTKSQKLELEQL
jgi:predicted DNA-binding protein (MmcQ/YjbR family)